MLTGQRLDELALDWRHVQKIETQKIGMHGFCSMTEFCELVPSLNVCREKIDPTLVLLSDEAW
jgi:hypothetical protein